MTPTVIDLMGQRFGKLVVTEFVGTKSRGKKAKWRCKCDCGNVATVYSTNLKRGYSTACGKCRQNIKNQFGSYDLRTYDSALSLFYRTVRTSADERSLVFDLSIDEAKNISKQNCFYCGKTPQQILKAKNKFGSDFVYNGIDRVDNEKGYTIDNIVACCKKCNQAKMNLTIDQFKSLVVSIYNNWANK